ncbi:MAG: cation:dicarboxylate symporter family transporter [Anaerolineae bacterium]
MSWQMLWATLLGLFTGIFFGNLCKVFASSADAYIMLLKMTTIPYLIVAIIHGVGQLSSTQAKEILKKGILFICFAWFINICIIYLTVFLFPKAKTPGQISYVPQQPSSINFAELLIPENIFYSLANNIVPAVVIFSLFTGIALMQLKKKDAMMQTLETTVDALTQITAWISRITPFGTFLIIANQVGTIHVSTIKQVSTYIFLYIIGICLVVFWIFPRLISMLTSLRPLQWLKYMLPILVLAYTTNVVIVALPYIIALLQRETQELDPKDEKAQSQIQGTVSIIFNLPLGSLFITVFVLFMSIFYNSPLSINGQIQLFSVSFLTGLGSVGLGSWINSLSFIFDFLGLPLDGINIYLVTLPFTAGFQSMVSAMEISSLSLLITLACRKKINFRLSKIIKSSVFTLLVVFAVASFLKIFNPFPHIQHAAKSINHLKMRQDVKTIVFSDSSQIEKIHFHEDTFDRIMKTKTLRVGYHAQVPPFCFFNNNGEVVGYDMAFAYELAHDLDCRLELIPLQYSLLTDELNTQLYDIGMSAISITEERLKSASFTHSYIDAPIVFITRDNRRKEFLSLKTILLQKHLKIAVLKGSSFEAFARKNFPEHPIIALDNYESFAQEPPIADAVLWEEEEAISWVLRHTHFSIAKPTPSLGIDSMGYPIKGGSPRFLNYLNQWLSLKKNEGFADSQYNLWVLGKTQAPLSEEPHWSVIRNVLHWVD